VLLRLVYLAMVNAFAMLRLLPMSDRDKDAEIRPLQLAVELAEQLVSDAREDLGPEERVRTAGGLGQEHARRFATPDLDLQVTATT
jgi:hypothetical protein